VNAGTEYYSVGLSDEWFRHLKYIPLSEAVAVVINYCHKELEAVAEGATKTLELLISTHTVESFDLKVFEWTRKRFFHSLRLHLEKEVRDVFRPFGSVGVLPDQETIHRMRVEHSQLVEALDLMNITLEHVQPVDSETRAVHRQARDWITRLDDILNAEILAEEIGIFRRFRPFRRFLYAE